MAFQIRLTNWNEDTGLASSSTLPNVYETEALATHIARQVLSEYWADDSNVVVADKTVYIKAQVEVEHIELRGDYYYGSPTHQAFGDSWLYADCEGAW